ncbi:hypothetical protein LWI29_034605 [Acer saccharum]|uniref:Uncharacterized protein n=1 Tax=Acer saccharum TaxID=4024 RepID=A0AA39RN22_ACESA|nr:hypothetical protein LWI29_034605 [Acer saccharum]
MDRAGGKSGNKGSEAALTAGKDHYPYPVGYHAVRAHNGSTCKIEIHDGTKGPLFMITSADGQSCSGQTPDMAWEKFQKKHYPQMKTWHGKRLSCKIDGVEVEKVRLELGKRRKRQSRMLVTKPSDFLQSCCSAPESSGLTT